MHDPSRHHLGLARPGAGQDEARLQRRSRPPPAAGASRFQSGRPSPSSGRVSSRVQAPPEPLASQTVQSAHATCAPSGRAGQLRRTGQVSQPSLRRAGKRLGRDRRDEPLQQVVHPGAAVGVRLERRLLARIPIAQRAAARPPPSRSSRLAALRAYSTAPLENGELVEAELRALRGVLRGSAGCGRSCSR